MNTATPSFPDSFQRCLDFHGHLCPGLVLGYQAAILAMNWLQEHRAEDEEIVTIAETDNCGCDAIQVITGCTFGKGNFLHRDYGKNAFTFFSRSSGKGIRISQKTQGVDVLSLKHRTLLEKLQKGECSNKEKQEFTKLHAEASHRLLAKQPYEIYDLTEIIEEIPRKAIMKPSLPCATCGEPTMSSKLINTDGENICRGCLERK